MLALVAICVLLFGKADSKREVLNIVGLDLSADSYNSQKESEFSKYCIRAMVNASDWYVGECDYEEQFLSKLADALDRGCYGDESNNLGYLHVEEHFIKHASNVVYRRSQDLKNTSSPVVNFVNKGERTRYIKWMWNKYQYPWPDTWKKKI